MDLGDFRNKAVIVGVGYTKEQGTVPGRSALSFAQEAAKAAIEDAGLKKDDIDGLLIQPTIGQQSYSVAAKLGLNNLKLLANEDVMGATAPCITAHAMFAVVTGQANYVLCLYGTASKSGSFSGMMMGGGGAMPPGPAYGVFGANMEYGLAARRAMYEYNTGPETWAEIAMSQRKWANLNPRATFYDRPMSKEDYLAEPWIAEPFRRADCCLVSDGGRAYIVTSAERLSLSPILISSVATASFSLTMGMIL